MKCFAYYICADELESSTIAARALSSMTQYSQHEYLGNEFFFPLGHRRRFGNSLTDFSLC